MAGIPVIDFDEAMSELGNDREFLVELLDDFKEELGEKMAILEDRVVSEVYNDRLLFIYPTDDYQLRDATVKQKRGVEL